MITKNYIKMCEKVEEIQKAWKPKVGDYYYEKGHHKIFDKKPYHYRAILESEKLYLFYKKQNDNIFEYKRFWLPTQEQLQEKILPIFLKIFSTTHALQNDPSFIHRMFIAEFEKWINRSSPSKDEYMVMFGSLVELLLAFVMKEKYNKIWTGKDWGKWKK